MSDDVRGSTSAAADALWRFLLQYRDQYAQDEERPNLATSTSRMVPG